jgi:hypothetical protein
MTRHPGEWREVSRTALYTLIDRCAGICLQLRMTELGL